MDVELRTVIQRIRRIATEMGHDLSHLTDDELLAHARELGPVVRGAGVSAAEAATVLGRFGTTGIRYDADDGRA
jgi:hypothetical protein